MSYKIKFNCLKFSSLLLFMLFFQFSFSQASKKNPKELGLASYPGLDALVMKHQEKLGKEVVAMVWTDTLVYKRELGMYDSRTVVPIAGSSQWLTTALVLKMAEEGKISLDDKVSDYIPIFSTYGKNYITIRHCLSHFTGIQSDAKLFEKKKFESLEAEVESYAKKEIKTNPGTEYSYSNVGMNIAGRILEIVSKKKFDMLIKQKLFNPLGMRKTSFTDMMGGPLNPSAGAKSTADEYMNFLKMLLNNGRHNGQQFLSEASIQELRRLTTEPSLVKYNPKSGEGFDYALGAWVLEAGSDQQAKAIACPGLYGTWPMVDWNRGYAFLFFTKELQGEQKKDLFMEIKSAIDEKIAPRSASR